MKAAAWNVTQRRTILTGRAGSCLIVREYMWGKVDAACMRELENTKQMPEG